MNKQTLTLGTHRKNRRVWLEHGTFLKEAGFKPGGTYTALYKPISQKIELKLDPKGPRKISAKRDDIPVIDLNSTKVGWALGEVEQIEVIYKPGLITIKVKK